MESWYVASSNFIDPVLGQQSRCVVRSPTPLNGTIFQGFEWYVSSEGDHFCNLARDIPYLHEIGITALWIPPACKANGIHDNGFGIYGEASGRRH